MLFVVIDGWSSTEGLQAPGDDEVADGGGEEGFASCLFESVQPAPPVTVHLYITTVDQRSSHGLCIPRIFGPLWAWLHLILLFYKNKNIFDNGNAIKLS